MIKGKKIITIDAEEILEYTNGGREVYERYLGKISKIMRRPWGTDSHPSWGIFKSDNVWLWKDQATEEVGTAIHFVMKLFNLSYRQAIEKIAFDFQLTDKEIISSKVYNMQQYEPNKYTHITADICAFKSYHHEYWNAAEVTEADCKREKCFAVKKLIVNRMKFHIYDKEPVFIYLADDIDKVKVYFPTRDKSKRFKNNVPGKYLWRYHALDRCDKLVIHKSMKDLITFSVLYPYNIATQNESIQVFDDENVNKINNVADDVWLFYGSDDDGVKKCKQITDKNKWNYINTPRHLLPEVNDIYSFVRMFGMKELEKFCIHKKLL